MGGRTFLSHFTCTVLILGASVAQAASPALSGRVVEDPALALGLVPHRALYDVNLTGARNGSQIIDISGKMYFEWKPTCEGWATDHRFTLRYDYADAEPMTISSDFSTFESLDGKSLDFSSRRKKDGEVYEELRGNARLEGKGGKGEAVFSLPEGLTFALGKDVIFPTMHTVNLIRKARQGSGFMKTTVFDGSDEEGPVEINAFVGKAFKQGEKSLLRRETGINQVAAGRIDEKLLGPGWKVQMAFFPVLNPESVSDYELTMAFHDNGVISDMQIEYGDFSVSQKLVALEKIPAASCKN